MTTEQAKFLLDFTLPTLKRETATTAKVIAATPDAHLDYRPSERCMTAAELLWHIASADVMFLDGILSGTFGKGPEKPESITSPEQISAWYMERMSAAIEKLSTYTPEEAAKILDLYGFLQAPAAGIITFAVGHSIHHRGQLSAYLRPMGGKVPSIYGPSADENPFAKAEAV
ncbi:MAG: DinB [Bryobacterales bacterium]|nr:DinB [Bryobacterales bacterium]